MSVCCVLWGRDICDELITRPEESYRLWCVILCDLVTSWMRRPWPTGRGGGLSRHKDKQTNKLNRADSLRSKEFLSRVFLYILWNSEIHYRIHISPPLIPIPINMIVMHPILVCSFKNYFNIILPSTPMFTKWPLSLRFPHQTSVCISLLHILSSFT